MHCDVHVMDIEDSESKSQQEKPQCRCGWIFREGSSSKRRQERAPKVQILRVRFFFFFYIYINDYLFTDRNGYGCTTRESILVYDCTTLRRHMASLHKVWLCFSIKFPFLINGTLTETIPRLVQGQQLPFYAAWGHQGAMCCHFGTPPTNRSPRSLPHCTTKW